MNNLARIISHGFAIVVVVLLGIGFIYRGELFPGLELPDFLVPESGKTVDTGVHPDKREAEASGGAESGGKQAEAVPSVSAVVPGEATGITAQPAAEPANVPEAAPAGEETSEGAVAKATLPETMEAATVTKSALEPPESVVEESASSAVETEEQGPAEGTAANATLPETEAVTESDVETPQSAVEETTPPVADKEEEEGPAAPASTEKAEPKGGVIPTTVPSPVAADETAVPPPVEEAVPLAGSQAGGGIEEPSPAPEVSPETASEGGPQTPGAGGQAATSGAIPEETAPDTTIPSAESAPAAVPEGEPAIAGAGLAAGKSIGESSVKGKPYELLAAAREAFWLHEYDDAEKNYRALTKLEPDNPDGYGELGNMYFAQGRWDEAAAAYYEAGTRLVKEGQLDAAREMVKVIRGLNGKQADDLEKLISSAAPSGND